MRSSFSRAFGKNKSREASEECKKTKNNDKRRSKSASRDHSFNGNDGYQYSQQSYQWSMGKPGLRMIERDSSDRERGSNPYQRSISASA